MRRKAGRLVVVLLALAVAGGCATVPTSGPVRFQPFEAGEQPEGADFEIMNVEPKPGDSAWQIVSGFLSTMYTYHPEHPMSREFLTPRAQAEWQPGRRVLVYDNALPVPAGDQDDVIRFSGSKIGMLGEDRGWRPAEPGSEIDLEFRLKKVNGEWRIDELPDYVIMSRENFEREFVPYNLYFYDPDFEILVPDPVYIPRRGDQPTTLVAAVLEGPTDHMEEVVRTVASPKIRLEVPTAQVDGRTVAIGLNDAVRDLTERQRELLAVQLVWTLKQYTDVTRVRLLVDGVPLDVFDDPDASIAAWRKYDPDVAESVNAGFVFQDGRFAAVQDGELVPRPSRFPELSFVPRTYAVSLFPRSVKQRDRIEAGATSVDGVALVGENGRTLWIYDGEGELRPIAPDFPFQEIVSLSWDRTGRLWVVDRKDGKARILVLDGTERPQVLKVPRLTGADVRELRVSRDGMMVAALVGQAPKSDRTQAFVGVVERDTGTPVIRHLRALETGYSQVTDIAWSDHAEVVVVGEDSVSTSHVAKVRVDGSLVEPVNDAPAAPVAVAATPGRPLLVVDAAGDLYLEDERAPWHSLGRAVQPTYPG